MNVEVHVSFQIIVFVFFGKIPRSGIARSYAISCLNFLRAVHTVAIVAATADILTINAQGFLFSMSLPILYVCRLFDNNHSDRCEMIAHYGTDLHFSEISDAEQFSCPFDHLYVFFEKKKKKQNVSLGLLPGFNFYFNVQPYQFFVHLNFNPLYYGLIATISSHLVSGLVLSLVSFSV